MTAVTAMGGEGVEKERRGNAREKAHLVVAIDERVPVCCAAGFHIGTRFDDNDYDDDDYDFDDDGDDDILMLDFFSCPHKQGTSRLRLTGYKSSALILEEQLKRKITEKSQNQI